MHTYIKEFLKRPDVQDMINNNNFTDVYSACLTHLLGYLTETLIAAGIDPCLHFSDGATMPYMFFDCDDIKEYRVPDNISFIKKETFSFSNSLSKIILPTSIKKIDRYAFRSCDISEIVYLGSKEDFKTIDVNERAFFKSKIASIQCRDGNIDISSPYS